MIVVEKNVSSSAAVVINWYVGAEVNCVKNFVFKSVVQLPPQPPALVRELTPRIAIAPVFAGMDDWS